MAMFPPRRPLAPVTTIISEPPCRLGRTPLSFADGVILAGRLNVATDEAYPRSPFDVGVPSSFRGRIGFESRIVKEDLLWTPARRLVGHPKDAVRFVNPSSDPATFL